MRVGIVISLVSSFYLLGLGFTVALVIYPAFSLVRSDDWPRFHEHHAQKIAWAVGPAWVAQALGLGLWLFGHPGATWIAWLLCAAASLGAVIITLIVAVPIHQQLSHQWRQDLDRRLRLSHWFRTLLWAVACFAGVIALIQTY